MEDYLALRQQLKQSIRVKRLQNDGGGGKEGLLAQNNYGCFFGPSETVFTGKAAEETRNLWSKFKSSPTVRDVAAMRKSTKVQMIRESRDYSFLSSPAAPIPVKGDSMVGKKPIKLIVKIGSIRVDQMLLPTKLKNSAAAAAQLKRCSGSISGSRANKKESIKTAVANVRKQQEMNSKKELKSVSVDKEEKKDESSVKTVSKPEEVKKEKRRVGEKRRSDYAVEIIRDMFGYYPNDFSDDDEDDDLNMEATFADIQKEEKRSAKLATMEDREELRQLQTTAAAAGYRKKMRLMN